jgi:hypothetical protein
MISSTPVRVVQVKEGRVERVGKACQSDNADHRERGHGRRQPQRPEEDRDETVEHDLDEERPVDDEGVRTLLARQAARAHPVEEEQALDVVPCRRGGREARERGGAG